MHIQAVSLVLLVLVVFLILWLIVKIHSFPGKIAAQRKHPQLDAIKVTSLLGLLIFPFWMFALIWAYSGATFGASYLPAEPDPAAGGSPDQRDKESRSHAKE
jgi:hypothetical protein